MGAIEPAGDSAGYAERIAEVFVETVQKAAANATCAEDEAEGITRSLMECMQYVYLHGASPISRIACGLAVSLPAASQLVDRLVKKGLATRRESKADRRLAEVELASAGREAVAGMRGRRYKWFASIVDAMPEKKRRAFVEGVEGFLAVAIEQEEDAGGTCDRCGIEHVPFCVVGKLKMHPKPGGPVRPAASAAPHSLCYRSNGGPAPSSSRKHTKEWKP